MSAALNDPFNRTTKPPGFDREDRVRLLGEAFTALIEGRLPSPEARMLLGSAGLTWLEEGGDLARDYLRVTSVRGSRNTASALWRAERDQASADPHRDERQEPESSIALRPISTE